MKNKPGSPVEGSDFFDRPRDLARLQRELRNGVNVLLSAPRRVGKTSLILRLCEISRKEGWSAVFCNVEGCADELSFAEKLVDELHRAGLNPEILSRVSLGFGRLRRNLGGMKFGAGIDVELGETEDPDHSTLGRALESVFRKIEADGKEVLIAIDELPELLFIMAKQEHGAQRVERLLHWLRGLRQTYRRHVHWVLLGSVGLDTFAETRSLGKAINDLTTTGLDALTSEEADRFLEILGRDNGLPLPPKARRAMIDRVGWPLPHHLQVFFHALVDSGCSEANETAITNAFRSLLAKDSYFDVWRQRLDEQFSAIDAAATKDILRHLCQHPQGRNRTQILNALMSTRTNADSAAVEDQLARLLVVLQRDGYLAESNGLYPFRSFLLREYWHRREIR